MRKTFLNNEYLQKKLLFTKRDGKNVKELSYIETIPLITEASLIAIEKYRKLAVDPSSDFYNHSVLPVLIAFLFSMSATSVNCERSFSDLNQRIGKNRHNLSDHSLHSGLLISGVISALNISCSLKELNDPLTEVLKRL